MSEYQYYEWQTIDRMLTREEQAAVNRLSSHIEVSPSRAVVTYSWSDFKHDPKQVLLKYFDAHFYAANWGSLHLMFRFPVGLLDTAAIEPYCVSEYISLETIGAYHILDIDFSPQESMGDWLEPEGDLSSFVRLRHDIVEGDYRLLYLAWLKAMTFEPYEDDYEDDADDGAGGVFPEPPVPPGLKDLSPSLEHFIDVFDIDPLLVQAAAETSPDLKSIPAADYRDLVARLPREECDGFLVRLAAGETGVASALRQRLSAYLLTDRPRQPAVRRTLDQLLERAGQIKQEARKRKAEEARQKHIAEMQALAAREPQVWQQVETLLEGRKIASVYDEATALLAKLKQLAEFQNTLDTFQSRLDKLAEKYAARPALIQRWQKKNWL